jgi:MscS family membrane protein
MLEVVRRPEGNWVLSADFVAGLAELRSRVADLPPIEGLHGARAWAFFLEDRMPDALRRTAFILPHWQWAALLALAFLGFAVDLLVYGLCRLLARRLLNPMRAESVETALHRAERPLGLVAMALLWLGGLYFINLPPRAYSWVAFGARLFAAVAFSFAAYRAVDVLSARLAYWASTSRNAVVGLLAPLVRRTLKIFVAIVAFLSLADRCGFDVSKMLIGLGVGGLALAMASKDTVENLFGSFTVVLDRPFKIGDWIKIGDVEGIVEEVGFRSTRIRTFSQSVVILPNFRMVNATIENNQERPKRRISATLSVNYGVKPETIEAFCEGIRELIRRQDSIDQDTFYVYLSECGAFSLDILVVCFVRAPDLDTELRERERLFTRILRLAGRLEVTFRAGAPASPSSPAIGSDFARELGRREAAALAGTGEGPAPSARAAPGKTT